MAGEALLALGLLSAVLTLNVYRPLGAPTLPAMASSFLGWTVGEFALHHITLQLALTLAFAASGGFGEVAGKLGLVLLLSSWGALFTHYWGGRRAGEVVDLAVRRAFGDAGDEAPRASASPSWRRILLPIPVRDAGVERIRDVDFGSGVGAPLRLDVYRPRAGGGPLPVLLYVHGGGWTIGSKNFQGLATCTHMASRGWLCVNADYRLSPRATFPDHIVDVKRAIRWVREEGARLGADPDFIVLTGGSAGGHLSALAALTPNDAEYQPGFEEIDTSVQGCIPFYGVFDFTGQQDHWPHRGLDESIERVVLKVGRQDDPEAFRRASPLHRVHPGAPPFLVIHGKADSLVPIEESRVFHRVLVEATGGRAALAEIPGAQHAFELFASLRTEHLRSALERFLGQLWSRHRRNTREAEVG
ncbi:MAG: alpha/beta hydrolase [Deltaproteobacteria bacterium]|nr:alpha/beta hydrolase [Deltaproteobacteria bacterium]